MIANADITIFVKRYVQKDRTEKLVPIQIKGVSFTSRKGTASANSGTEQRDTYTIRIPAEADTSGKKYVDQMEYAKLDEETYPGYWTLQPGALIVRGLSELEEATETELKKQYPEVVYVTNFTDNRDRGSEYMRHWRIGGE